MSVADLYKFEPTGPDVSRLPRGKVRAPGNPSALEDHLGRDPHAVEILLARSSNALLDELWGHLLVGVKMEHPWVPKRNLRLGIIALSREIIEFAVIYPRPGRLGDFNGAVGRPGVQDHNVVAGGRRLDAFPEVLLLV